MLNLINGEYEEKNLVRHSDINILSASQISVKSISGKSENYPNYIMDHGPVDSTYNVGLMFPYPSSSAQFQKSLSESVLVSNTAIDSKLNCFSVYHYSSGKVLHFDKEKIINNHKSNSNQIYTDLLEFSTSSIIKKFVSADKIEKKKQMKNRKQNSKFTNQVIFSFFGTIVTCWILFFQ